MPVRAAAARTCERGQESETMATQRTGLPSNSLSQAARASRVAIEWSWSGRKKTKTLARTFGERRGSRRPSAVGRSSLWRTSPGETSAKARSAPGQSAPASDAAKPRGRRRLTPRSGLLLGRARVRGPVHVALGLVAGPGARAAGGRAGEVDLQ